MTELLTINPAKQTTKIVNFIKTTFRQQGFKQGIIAISGGLDSATSLILATQALGPANILALQLPYVKQSLTDSSLILKTADIPRANRLIFKLKPSVDSLAKSLQASQAKLRLGNIIARTRMIHLFDQAKKHRALVIGTENKSENLLGYFTRYGDAASDIEPLSHLYKTQVYQLASYLGIPQSILGKAPSAGLWPQQTDQQELGFSYQQADPILHLLVDKQMTPSQVINQGFPQALVKRVAKRLSALDFKHNLPYHI